MENRSVAERDEAQRSQTAGRRSAWRWGTFPRRCRLRSKKPDRSGGSRLRRRSERRRISRKALRASAPRGTCCLSSCRSRVGRSGSPIFESVTSAGDLQITVGDGVLVIAPRLQRLAQGQEMRPAPVPAQGPGDLRLALLATEMPQPRQRLGGAFARDIRIVCLLKFSKIQLAYITP